MGTIDDNKFSIGTNCCLQLPLVFEDQGQESAGQTCATRPEAHQGLSCLSFRCPSIQMSPLFQLLPQLTNAQL